MLFIAMGLIVALVATDFLELTRRGAERQNVRLSGRGSRMIGPK